MWENSAFYSRLLFAFALVWAAVMSFIMCSDAARASPITTQVDNGVKHIVLRRLYTPYSQHPPLSAGLPTETGLQTGTNSETEMSRNHREGLSIIDHQSSPLRLTDRSFSYSQNNPNNRQSQVRMTRVQSEVRPASSIFTSRSQHGGQSLEGWQSRGNYHPLSQKVDQSLNSYNSYPVIIRKSSHKEAAGPFRQSSSPSQVWDPTHAQKSYEVPRSDSPKVAEDKTVWQPSDSSRFSSQTGRYWRTSLPPPVEHYSGYKETNELAVTSPQSTSSGIQSRKFVSIASQTAPHASSFINSLDSSVIKSNPSPDKLTSSITGFYQGRHSVSSSKTPTHKKVQLYLSKDSHTSFGGHEPVNTVTGDGPSAIAPTPHKLRPSDAQVYGRFSSYFKQLQQSQRKDLTKEVQHISDNANPLYRNANVAQYGAQTDSSTKFQRTTAETLAQISVNPAPGKDDTVESVFPKTHADFKGTYATDSRKSVVSEQVNINTRGSMHAYKPGKTIKSDYGFRGFKNPSILSSSRSNERTNALQNSFDKGKFKIANIYQSLSPKYSFGQREASTWTTAPPKLERTPTYYSSPSTATLDIVQTMTTTRPLEGAKTSVSESEKSTGVLQGLESLKLGSSQIWQLKNSKIHRWYNKTGETVPGTSHVSTMSQNQLSSEDLKLLLKTTGSTESVIRFTPDKYKNNRKIYKPTSLGFHPVQNRIGNASNRTHWTYKEQNPTAPPSHRISSADVGSGGDLKVESSPKSETRTPNKPEIKPVAMKQSLLNSATSSTVRGQRVKVKQTKGKKLNKSTSLINDTGNITIVRLPKQPARFKAVTFADILGSASFSGVTATITPAYLDYFPNGTTTTTKQQEGVVHWTLNSEDAVHSRDNTSRGPEAHARDEEEDFRSVEENKLGVRSEEADSDMKTSDLFLENEGSGGLNMSVFAADTTKTQGLTEDLLDLDYLRISAGNTSFKSMKLSKSEK